MSRHRWVKILEDRKFGYSISGVGEVPFNGEDRHSEDKVLTERT